MTSVYVTNVVRKVEVTPGATGGSGGGGGTGNLTTNNSWTGTNAFNNNVSVVAASAVAVPVTIRGTGTQTAPMTEWRNSSNTVIAAVDAIGQISSATNIYVGRGVSASGGNKVLVLSNATPPTTDPVGGGILYAENGNLKYRSSSGAFYVPVPSTGAKGDLLVHNGTDWTKVNAGTNGYVLTANSGVTAGVQWSAAGAGGGHTIASAGTPFTQRATLNFIGATVADDAGNNRTNVTITSGANYQTFKANGVARTVRPAANFGAMFTLTDDGVNSETDIAIVSDQAAGTASLRTLGSGSTQAAAGNHTHSYLDATHISDLDPHTQYLTQEEADGLYASTAKIPPVGGTTGQVLSKASNTDYAFQWTNNNASVALPWTAVATDTAQVPVTIRAANGQATHFFRIQSSGSTDWFFVNSFGESGHGAGSASLPGMVKVIPWADANKGVVVRQKTANQTGNMIEVQNHDGTVELMSVSANGTITAPNIGTPVIVLGPLDPVPGGTLTGTVILRTA